MVNESRWFPLLIHRTYRGKTPTLPDAKIRRSQHPVLSFYVYTHFCCGSHWRARGTWKSTTHASHLRNGQGATWGRSPLHWYCGLIMSMWCWVLHCADLFLIVLQVCLSYYNLFVCFNQFSFLENFSSVTESCPTLCNPMDCSMPGFSIHHQLPELAQTHAHRVVDAIQPSHPLSSPSPPALSLSQNQGLFQWVSSSCQVAKVLEFQLQHQSFQCTFRIDFL